ncbi:Hypothetical protein HVR_LOCUS329 [uncultured virus]|nr:Hypothetical protein HVR_LOCUS329 [uncultured virus]
MHRVSDTKYYNNVSTPSEKDLPYKIVKFFTEWAIRNNFSPQMEALMTNYNHCVNLNRANLHSRDYKLGPDMFQISKNQSSLDMLQISKKQPSPRTENFISVISETTKGLPPLFQDFIRLWAKSNGYIVQIKALIEHYNKCVETNLKKEEEICLRAQLDNMQFLVRLQIGNDNIRWLCLPQTCKTENDQLVCVEENGWCPISLNEVTLIIRGPQDLIESVILDEAKEQGIDVPKSDEDITLVFTERSRYPYVVNGGLLFCRKWVSSNTVAAQKIVLSETIGDTRMTINEGDQSTIINKVIAFHHVVNDDKSELCFCDETGTKHIINFNVEHDKHFNHKCRQLPLENIIINYYVAKFIDDLIFSQMSNDSDDVVAIKMKDGETPRILILAPKEFDYKDGKLYLEDREMFEIDLSSEEIIGTFKNT